MLVTVVFNPRSPCSWPAWSSARCPMAGGWNKMIPKFSSNPNNPVILWVMGDWVMGGELQARAKCDFKVPQNYQLLILALADQEKKRISRFGNYFCDVSWQDTNTRVKEGRQPPTSTHPVGVTLSTLLFPLFPCSTPHWFGSLVAVSGQRQLQVHTLSQARHRDAQLSSSLGSCPDLLLLLPGWLSGCWSAPRTQCPCSSPETPRSGTPPARTQREEAQRDKSKHTRTRCSHHPPAVRSSAQNPGRGKEQLEFKGHFLSTLIWVKAKSLPGNADCFLVSKLLCMEVRGKKCKDHQ